MHPIIVNDFVYGKEFIVDVKELNVNLTKNFDVKVQVTLLFLEEQAFLQKVAFLTFVARTDCITSTM